ncbi:MAG: hypothetical protein AAGB18_02390 [Pseudomonadota bacterium]
MVRLVLATGIVAAILAALAILVLGLWSSRRGASGQAGTMEDTSLMQKIAYALLVALILYAAIQGAAA